MIPDLLQPCSSHAARRLLGRAVLVVTVSSALAVFGACDKVPLFAPTGTTITLFSNTPVLALNGSAEITASVLESAGTPVQNGTVVTFTTTLGTIEPVEAKTTNGKATVRLLAGTRSGTAEVSAFSGANASEAAVSILVGAAAAGNVLVIASPSTVSSTGGSVQIVATVQDEGGNSLSGVPVSFTSDVGTLSPMTAVSQQNGQAQSTLTTNQTAIVTVTAGAQTGTVTVTAIPVPTITITPPSTTPSVGVSATFTLNVQAGNTMVPIRNVTVDFGDGSRAVSLGAASGSISLPHTFRDSGTFTVTATAIDANGLTTTVATPVDVFPAVPFVVTVTAPSGRVNQPVVMTATPAAGAPVIARYDWNFGDGTTATTSVGTVPKIYTSITGTSQQFVVTVTATGVDGRTGVGSAIVIITP